MKSVIKILLIIGVFSGLVKAEEVIKIAAQPTPHAEILEVVKPILKKQGYKLEIYETTDGVVPNVSVNDGSLDANFFQHVPYMKASNERLGTKLVSAGAVHIEPMGIYSKKHKSLDNVPNGAKFTIPNNPSNENRALHILQSAGLIKVQEKGGLSTVADITSNPKKLIITPIKDAQLVRSLEEVDYSVINSNFVMYHNMRPSKDALFVEKDYQTYGNVIAVKQGNENSPKIKALMKALHSQEVKDFLQEKFQGDVLAAF